MILRAEGRNPRELFDHTLGGLARRAHEKYMGWSYELCEVK